MKRRVLCFIGMTLFDEMSALIGLDISKLILSRKSYGEDTVMRSYLEIFFTWSIDRRDLGYQRWSKWAGKRWYECMMLFFFNITSSFVFLKKFFLYASSVVLFRVENYVINCIMIIREFTKSNFNIFLYWVGYRINIESNRYSKKNYILLHLRNHDMSYHLVDDDEIRS